MAWVPDGAGIVLVIGGLGSATIGGVISATIAAGAYTSGLWVTGIVATVMTGLQAVFIALVVVMLLSEGEVPWVIWVNVALTLAAVGWTLGFWIRQLRGRNRPEGDGNPGSAER